MNIAMKNIFYAVIAAVSLWSLAGCEKFLDKTPLDEIGSSTELNGDDAVALVNGAYQVLLKLYNMRMWTTDIIANESRVGGDMGTQGDGIETLLLRNFSASPNNLASTELWGSTNAGILRCNLALQRIPEIDMDAGLKERLLGEAYFLRAHFYFINVRVFGGVPIRTEPVVAGDPLEVARNTREEVYTLIEEDSRKAIEMLPAKADYDSADLGRACREAAMCQLAKVYLTRGTNYGEAAALCTQIEAMGYDLSTPYYENFDYTVDNTAESIFEVQYTNKSATKNFWSDWDNQVAWHSTFMGPRNSGWVGGSWGWSHVEQHFVDAYEPGDLRKDVTILYEGCPPFEGKPYDPTWSTTGYNVRKFLVPVSWADNYDNNDNNFVVYRFADVLLMKAEALNEQGLTSEAAAPLNTVRGRAGLPAKPTTLSYEDMKEAIIHERRIELAFEGHRWFDLIRIDGGQYAVNFFHSIGQTRANIDRLLYPIPQGEIDANPLLEQNPGY
jgi:hypothetical protein